MSETHNKDDEEQQDHEKFTELPLDAAIQLSKVSFRYLGSDQLVLKDSDLVILPKKVPKSNGLRKKCSCLKTGFRRLTN